MTDENAEPLLVFVHIRKTAGKTLRQVFYRQYGRDNTHLVRSAERSRESVRELAARDDLRVLHGHIPFWPDLEWPERTRFVTMLRDPVERTLSHYFWTKSKKSPDWAMSLEEALTNGLIVDNYQVRVLADAMTGPPAIGRDHLELALERLDQFAVVGVTNRFDESLALMTQVLGWQWRLYRSENVTRNRKACDEVPPETILRIEEINVLDRELYEAARARLEADLAAQDDAFAIELTALTRASAIAAGGDRHAGDDNPRVAARVQELLRDAQAEAAGATPKRRRLPAIGQRPR